MVMLGELRRGVEWLVRSVVAAVVTAFAEPPPPRSRRLRLRLGRLGRFLPVREIDLVVLADVIVAAAVYGGHAASLVTANNAAGRPFSEPFLHVVALATAFPLLLRDRWPLAAWRTSLLVLLLTSVPVDRLLPSPIPPAGSLVYLLCLYSVAARSGRDVAVGAWVVSVLALWVVDPPSVFVGAGLAGVPLLFGHNVRVRRQTQAELADQERRSEEERAARAVLQERSRIARELHDVVAHHMSVIAIQAEAAPLRTPEVPVELRRDLAEIRTTALEALTEMRRVLGLLHDGSGDGETMPQPGLDRLDDLVAGAHVGGLTVSTTVSGRPVPLPPAVGLSAYRIVQESLSNAMQHAPGSTVVVEVTYVERPAALRLRVENGPPSGVGRPARDGAPHGLIGMRERAVMLSGDLQARPTPEGGFAVVATLPLEGK
jgi:signal transduction histidine kinase